jgi:hypothetical protein
MTVDIVVNKLSDLNGGAHNIGAGALAWCSDAAEMRLAVQPELGGDWVPLFQAGAFWTDFVDVSGTIAVNTAVDYLVTFPTGFFTQPPVIAFGSGSARYNPSVKAGTLTKNGFTLRVGNYSNVNATDSADVVHVIALQNLASGA